MAVDRSSLDAQLREIGEGERWWEQREFRDLPHILHADERLQGLVRGRLLGKRRPRLTPPGTWLFVATDQRLICLKQERFARRQIEIAWQEIARVSHSNRLRSHQVAIEVPPRRYRIRVDKDDAYRFGAVLGRNIPDPAPPRLSPELEPLAWIPGMATVASLPGVAGIVSKVMMLSPPDPSDAEVRRGRADSRMEQMYSEVEQLKSEVYQLRQRVGFLEDLLQQRVDEALISGRDNA